MLVVYCLTLKSTNGVIWIETNKIYECVLLTVCFNWFHNSKSRKSSPILKKIFLIEIFATHYRTYYEKRVSLRKESNTQWDRRIKGSVLLLGSLIDSLGGGATVKVCAFGFASWAHYRLINDDICLNDFLSRHRCARGSEVLIAQSKYSYFHSLL